MAVITLIISLVVAGVIGYFLGYKKGKKVPTWIEKEWIDKQVGTGRMQQE